MACSGGGQCREEGYSGDDRACRSHRGIFADRTGHWSGEKFGRRPRTMSHEMIGRWRATGLPDRTRGRAVSG